MTELVHLHVHTEYSLLDGAAKAEYLAGHTVRNGNEKKGGDIVQ